MNQDAWSFPGCEFRPSQSEKSEKVTHEGSDRPAGSRQEVQTRVHKKELPSQTPDEAPEVRQTPDEGVLSTDPNLLP